MDRKKLEEERDTARKLISVSFWLCVSLFFLPAWFLANQEIRVGPSDGSGPVKFVRWEDAPGEFLALMGLTVLCIGLCWLLRAYMTKHLRRQVEEAEAKLESGR